MGLDDDVVVWLPVLPESVGLARHRVRRFARLAPDADSVVGLLVTEIVGAAVAALPPTSARHIELRLSRRHDRLRATVSAVGLALHGLEGRPEGFGSVIVERLADDWGATDDGLWFEVHARAPEGARLR